MRALFLAAAFVALAVQPAIAEENRRSRLEEAFFLGNSAVSAELSRVPFWQDLVARERKSEASNSAPLDDLVRSARGSSTDETKATLALVNIAINKANYVSDRANFASADVWQTADELSKRGGDCEDFAAAKYFALRKLGYSVSALEIALVFDERTKNRHAVLMVRLDDEVVVLDNLSNAILPAAALDHYRPLLALNEAGFKVAAPTLRSARIVQTAAIGTQTPVRQHLEQISLHQTPNSAKADTGVKRANLHSHQPNVPLANSLSDLIACFEQQHPAKVLSLEVPPQEPPAHTTYSSDFRNARVGSPHWDGVSA